MRGAGMAEYLNMGNVNAGLLGLCSLAEKRKGSGEWPEALGQRLGLQGWVEFELVGVGITSASQPRAIFLQGTFSHVWLHFFFFFCHTWGQGRVITSGGRTEMLLNLLQCIRPPQPRNSLVQIFRIAENETPGLDKRHSEQVS